MNTSANFIDNPNAMSANTLLDMFNMGQQKRQADYSNLATQGMAEFSANEKERQRLLLRASKEGWTPEQLNDQLATHKHQYKNTLMALNQATGNRMSDTDLDVKVEEYFSRYIPQFGQKPPAKPKTNTNTQVGGTKPPANVATTTPPPATVAPPVVETAKPAISVTALSPQLRSPIQHNKDLNIYAVNGTNGVPIIQDSSMASLQQQYEAVKRIAYGEGTEEDYRMWYRRMTKANADLNAKNKYRLLDEMGFEASNPWQIGQVDPSDPGNATGYKEGGAVTGPTVALLGEGGEDEFIVPRSKAIQWARLLLQNPDNPPNPADLESMPSFEEGGVVIPEMDATEKAFRMDLAKRFPKDAQWIATAPLEDVKKSSPITAARFYPAPVQDQPQPQAQPVQIGEQAQVAPETSQQRASDYFTSTRSPSTVVPAKEKLYQEQIDPSLSREQPYQEKINSSLSRPSSDSPSPGASSASTPSPDSPFGKPDKQADTARQIFAKTNFPDDVLLEELRGVSKESLARMGTEKPKLVQDVLQKKRDEAFAKAAGQIMVSQTFKTMSKQISGDYAEWFKTATPEEMSLVMGLEDAAKYRDAREGRDLQYKMNQEDMALKWKYYALQEAAQGGDEDAALLKSMVDYSVKLLEVHKEEINKKGAAAVASTNPYVASAFNMLGRMFNMSEQTTRKRLLGIGAAMFEPALLGDTRQTGNQGGQTANLDAVINAARGQPTQGK